jgi:hypothetical protein
MRLAIATPGSGIAGHCSRGPSGVTAGEFDANVIPFDRIPRQAATRS